MSETISSGVGEKAQSLIGDTASAARDIAERTTATTGQTLSQSMDSAMDSMQQIRRRLEDAAQGLPRAPTSSRLAWRAGRWLGRVEGVIWLGSKGVGIWWGRTKKRLQHQPPDERARMLAQWGPSVIATGWLSAQVWNRLHGSGMKKREGS